LYLPVVLRRTFLEDAAVPSLIDQFWPMAVTATATLAAAGWLYRRRVYWQDVTPAPHDVAGECGRCGMMARRLHSL
jgi:hypothetical protein